MSDITLSASIRSTLLSLSETNDLIDQTNLRLATGLEVASPVDDPIAFFAAEALSDRAEEFTLAFDEIDQGISAVTAALDGIEGVDSLTRQLAGLVSSLRSSSGQQFLDLAAQFNDIRDQIDELANDTEFQGLNLIDNTADELTVNFSDTTTAFLTIEAVNLTSTGALGIDELFTTADLTDEISADGVSGAISEFLTGVDSSTIAFAAATGGIQFAFGFNTGSVSAAAVGADAATGFESTITVTFNGTGSRVFEASGAGALTFSFGTAEIVIQSNTQADVTVSQGDVLTLLVTSAATSTTGAGFGSTGATGNSSGFLFTTDTQLFAVVDFEVINTLATTGLGAASLTEDTEIATTGSTVDASLVEDLAAAGAFNSSGLGLDFVQIGNSGLLDEVDFGLDSALDTLAAEAATLGSNVAVLNTRLDFTEAYVNTLEEAAASLTLADLNTEGANLIALQTRQALGINALAFAGQSEQSILSLFP